MLQRRYRYDKKHTGPSDERNTSNNSALRRLARYNRTRSFGVNDTSSVSWRVTLTCIFFVVVSIGSTLRAPKGPSIAMEHRVHEDTEAGGSALVSPVQSPLINIVGRESSSLVLTAYIEQPSGSVAQQQQLQSLSNRTTTARQLQKQEFPSAPARTYCTRPYEYLPVNQFPEQDPFLPW